MTPESVVFAPGASENGLAVMLADLLRQNVEAKPQKARDFKSLSASVALVAEDAGVALTLVFKSGGLTVHDGIHDVPDVTIRGSSDALLGLSNWPLTPKWSLPVIPW